MIKSIAKLHYLLGLSFCLSIVLVSCGGGGGQGKDYVESVVEDPTQGILAEIKEVKTDIFKITNEELLPKREDSQIIASFMDGTVDTFSLEEIKLTKHNDPKRSMIRNIAMGGMIGYMAGRAFSSPLSRQSYADDKSFKKSSTTGKSTLRNTAARKTVRTPKAKGSGFGSKKTSRSYGG